MHACRGEGSCRETGSLSIAHKISGCVGLNDMGEMGRKIKESRSNGERGKQTPADCELKPRAAEPKRATRASKTPQNR